MGPQIIRVFACLCLGLAGALGREDRSDTDLPSDRYFATYAKETPRLDGKLEEWQQVWTGAVRADAAEAAQRGIVAGTAAAFDRENYRVEVAFQWEAKGRMSKGANERRGKRRRFADSPIRRFADSPIRRFADSKQSLFLAARVWDDHLVAVQRDEKGQIPSPWAFDTLLMRLSSWGRTAATGRYADQPTLDLPQPGPTFAFSYYEPGKEGFPQQPGVQYICREWEQGYTVEAVVPFEVCGYEVEPGDRIRFSLELVDHDPASRAGEPERVGQMLWRCWTGYGAPVNLTDERAAWPELRFLDESGWGGDLLLDRNRYPEGDTLRLYLDVDTRQKAGTLQRFRLLNPAGAVKKTVERSTLLKRGAPNAFGAEIPLTGLAPGSCRVVAEAVLEGGLAKKVEADFAIVSPGGGQSLPESTLPMSSRPRFVEDPCRYFQVAALQYPPPREITKQDYVNWLRTYFERFSAGAYRNVYKNPGMPPAEFVLACAALYDATGEEPYCQDTLQGFRAFHAGLPHITKPIYVNGAHFACFLWAWDVLRKHQRVTPEDEAIFREILRVGIPQSQYASSPSERERDPGNRGLSRAAVLGGTAHLIPDLPQAADWKDYAQKVWNDQWPFRDTCENTSGYNCYWLTILLGYVHAIGFEEEFYRDEGMKKLMERLLYQQAPSGLRPAYGDGGGALSGGGYVGLLELLAARYQDGRYKWAARRIFDHLVRCTMDDYYNYWNEWQGLYASIALAILFADEGLKEVPCDGASRITYRKYMEPLPPSRREEELRWWYLRDRVIPDKLILSSGNRYEDLWAMVDLCPQAGHGHPDAPAFVFLTAHGSTLLCDEGYAEREPKYHNLMVLEDLQGIQPVPEEEQIQAPIFEEGQETTFARVEVQNYKQFPVQQTREVFFLKNRFIWVRDTVAFDRPFLCTAGPQWRARQIGPGVGPHYAVTFFDLVPGGWYGKARQAERSNRFLNPAWNLLVYFLPRPGCALQIGDESPETLWRNAPQPLQYQWRGLGQPGQPLRFDSLLYPHHPSPDPEAVMKQIQVVLEEGDTVVFRAEFSRWRKGVFPNLEATPETIWVALNPGGKAIKAGELETDAQWVYLRVENGQPQHLCARAATHVRLGGQALYASGEPGGVDGAIAGKRP